MNPGELKEKISVVALVSDGSNFMWESQKVIWAKAEILNTKNIFSSIGMGARTVKFLVRKQNLSLHSAFIWKGNHCFLTAINEENRLYYEVLTAIVTISKCHIKREPDPTYNNLNRPVYSEPTLITFPGIVTEKFLGNTQEQPMTTIETRLVLVTPKLIKLEEGELVTINEKDYEVLISHTLDEFKNEYEIISRRNV